MIQRKDRLLAVIATLVGMALSPLFIHEGWADPALGPSLKVLDNVTTVAGAKTLKFTSGCVVTANGPEADVACTGSGGTVTSVTASAPIASSGGATPNISLNTSGVSAGTYSTANITVSSQGIITSASAGGNGGAADPFYYSDGADGAVTFDGSTTITLTGSGQSNQTLVPSGNTYTLLHATKFTNATVNAGVTVKFNGNRLGGNGTLTVAGHVTGDGAAAGAGGAGCPVPTFSTSFHYCSSNSSCGTQGGTSPGGNLSGNVGGPSQNWALGEQGGSGGGGCGHAPAAGGTITRTTVDHDDWTPFFLQGFFYNQTVGPIQFFGGTGGGGGDSGTNSNGGGGGCGADYAVVAFPNITISGAGTITVNGGNGGAGAVATGTCGSGGGGGGGGNLVIIYQNALTGFPFATTTGQNTSCAAAWAKGGNGGALAGTGANGSTGTTGHCYILAH